MPKETKRNEIVKQATLLTAEEVAAAAAAQTEAAQKKLRAKPNGIQGVDYVTMSSALAAGTDNATAARAASSVA